MEKTRAHQQVGGTGAAGVLGMDALCWCVVQCGQVACHRARRLWSLLVCHAMSPRSSTGQSPKVVLTCCCWWWWCRAWLHTCLHILVQLHQRYVAPEGFTPPPANLFWDPSLLQDGNTPLSDMYRCEGLAAAGGVLVCRVVSCYSAGLRAGQHHLRLTSASFRQHIVQS